jgi:hypothetical protein
VGEIIRNLVDRMLCPHSSNFPVHEAHQLRTRMLDGFYEAAEKDEDGEMAEPLEKAYLAAKDRVNDYMDLFVHTANIMRGRQFVTVETWWWKCPTCALVLPATSVERRP